MTLQTGMIAPEFLEMAARYNVNVTGVVEAFWQPVYDVLDYAGAGVQQLRFFQNPVGQNGRTFSDTNMLSAGAFPAPQQFLATEITVEILPGVLPSRIGGADVGAAAFLDDMYTLSTAGVVELNIGSKNMLRDSPLGKFPPTQRLEVAAALADTTTAGANRVSAINYAAPAGLVYQMTPRVIPWAQNFDVSLLFPGGLVPLPSGQDARIRCTLNGYLYRLAQ